MDARTPFRPCPAGGAPQRRRRARRKGSTPLSGPDRGLGNRFRIDIGRKRGQVLAGMFGLALAAPAAAPAQSFDEAVRANLALGIEICLGGPPDVQSMRNAFASAGFAYEPEDYGGGDILHWYAAPAGTANVAVVGAWGDAECRVGSAHMGVTEAVAFTGQVLEKRFPGVFSYGNMENRPPVTVETMGDRWEFCTGYIGWAGQRPITVDVGNQGQDPACIADGTSQIVIRR